MTTLIRPSADEYAPYYQQYIAQVPQGDLMALLETQLQDTLTLLKDVPEERADHRYASGKWSVKEVVGHMADTERVMAYRLLRIARGDATPLPGFDQDSYVAQAGFDGRTLADLLAEFQAVRQATVALLHGLGEEAFVRRGTANGVLTSARALAYIIAGHERHHGQVLRAKYGIGETAAA